MTKYEKSSFLVCGLGNVTVYRISGDENYKHWAYSKAKCCVRNPIMQNWKPVTGKMPYWAEATLEFLSSVLY